MYGRLQTPPPPGDGSGSPGRAAFRGELDAFRDSWPLHDFEASTREFIGQDALTPVLLVQGPPGTGKSYSTAFHAAMAEFLRQEVYRHDGIAYHSQKLDRLDAHPVADDLATAVLDPDYPFVVVVHDEAECQMRNPFEQAKRKMVLVAGRSIFSLFCPDEETFANSLLWKNLLKRTCIPLLWEGEREGKRVAVWGGKYEPET